MRRLFANNATTTLATSVGPSTTTVVVASGTGGLFPSPSLGTTIFKATLEDLLAGTREIVHVTGRSGDTLTVIRAQEGTTALSFSSGSTTVSNRVTSDTLQQLEDSTSYFNTYYIGPHASPPAVDGQGNPLVAGALYFNTTANQMFVHNGDTWTAPVRPVPGSIAEYSFTSSSSQTVFVGADDNGETLACDPDDDLVTIHVDGVLFKDTVQYTVTADTITFVSPLTSGKWVDIAVVARSSVPTASTAKKINTSPWVFDGSANTFSLVTTEGGVVTPGAAEDLIVVRDGIIQEPQIDYNTSANFITFSSAPSADTKITAVVGLPTHASTPERVAIDQGRVALGSSGPLSIDGDRGNFFSADLLGNASFSLLNMNDGAPYVVRIKNGANWTATWSSDFYWLGEVNPNTAPSIAIGANKISVIHGVWDGGVSKFIATMAVDQ